MMSKMLSPHVARQKIERVCTQRERSPKEVQVKLSSWSISGSEQKAILDKLVENNYLNEERFVKAFCNDKFRINKWGTDKN